MNIHTLQPTHPLKSPKRIGRGGKKGTYSGKGMKGQKARSGAKISPVFTGGAPALGGQGSRYLHRKRGLSNVVLTKNTKVWKSISIDKIIDIFEDGATVSLESLVNAGLIKGGQKYVKILGGRSSQDSKKKFTFDSVTLSKSVQTQYVL